MKDCFRSLFLPLKLMLQPAIITAINKIESTNIHKSIKVLNYSHRIFNFMTVLTSIRKSHNHSIIKHKIFMKKLFYSWVSSDKQLEQF